MTHPTNRKLANVSEESSHVSAAFQFVEGNPFIATFWAGAEGFHTTVNGRHETSFAYREVKLVYFNFHLSIYECVLK